MLKLFSISLILIFLLSMYFTYSFDPIRVMAYVSMGLALSAVSIVVYYRRAELLATECVHIGLFAITLGYIVEYLYGISAFLIAIFMGLIIVHLANYMVHLGISVEKASAVVVSFVSAMSVIAIHYILVYIPVRYSLPAIIIGDPLLITRNEAITAICISILVLFIVILTIKELINTSIDPVSASLAGLRTRVYDFIAYTIIGLTAIGLLRLAGYVMEHILLLLPAIVSSLYSSSLREHIVNTILVGASFSALGFALAKQLNTTPTGLTGLLIMILIVINYMVRRL
ncbi:MAG: metal ABC transporter permease [Desulfurococcaceae archaeon]